MMTEAMALPLTEEVASRLSKEQGESNDERHVFRYRDLPYSLNYYFVIQFVHKMRPVS